MLYLLSCFLCFAGAHARACTLTMTFPSLFYRCPLARAAQFNDLWPLFPVLPSLRITLVASPPGVKNVLCVRGGIVDEDRLWAIHLHRADAVQVCFAPRAALAVTRHKRRCLIHDPVAVAPVSVCFPWLRWRCRVRRSPLRRRLPFQPRRMQSSPSGRRSCCNIMLKGAIMVMGSSWVKVKVRSFFFRRGFLCGYGFPPAAMRSASKIAIRFINDSPLETLLLH